MRTRRWTTRALLAVVLTTAGLLGLLGAGSHGMAGHIQADSIQPPPPSYAGQ